MIAMHFRKTTFTIAASLATVCGGVVFAATSVRALFYSPEPEIPQPSKEAQAPLRTAPAAERPERLKIPALGIDTAVQYVGVKADGNMAMPNNYTDVGWYKYGTIPGQWGSAVLAAHVDNALSLDGVFKHLKDLKVGDDVYIETEGKSALHFVVTATQSYPYQEVPAEEIFNARDAARLNLITCDGTWLPHKRTYDRRLVVFTQLVA